MAFLMLIVEHQSPPGRRHRPDPPVRRADTIALSGGEQPSGRCRLARRAARAFLRRARAWPCAGLRAFVLSADGHAKMKRMFVDAAARGMGIGQAIMERWSEKRRVWASH